MGIKNTKQEKTELGETKTHAEQEWPIEWEGKEGKTQMGQQQ